MSLVISTFQDGITDHTHKLLIQQPRVNEFPELVERVRAINPYQQTPLARTTLAKIGIQSDPMAARWHVHPASKAIENAMLAHLSYLHPSREPLTCLYIKPQKLRQLRRHPNNTFILNTLNTVKDLSRYPTSTLVNCFANRINTSTAFMHDAIHYMTPEQITSIFEHNPKLHTLYCTTVLPPEARFGHLSLYPELYTLQYPNDLYFTFLPDGHAGGAYHQPRLGLQWLLINKITGPVPLSVEKLETMGPNHLFAITRSQLISEPIYSFPCPDLISLPRIYQPKGANLQQPIERELFDKLVAYAHTISDGGGKIVTSRDLWARLRQSLVEERKTYYSPHTLTLLVDYVQVLSTYSSSNDAFNITQSSLLMRACVGPYAYLRDALRNVIGLSSFQAHQAMLDVTPFTYNTTPQPYHVDKTGWHPSLKPVLWEKDEVGLDIVPYSQFYDQDDPEPSSDTQQPNITSPTTCLTQKPEPKVKFATIHHFDTPFFQCRGFQNLTSTVLLCKAESNQHSNHMNSASVLPIKIFSNITPAPAQVQDVCGQLTSPSDPFVPNDCQTKDLSPIKNSGNGENLCLYISVIQAAKLSLQPKQLKQDLCALAISRHPDLTGFQDHAKSKSFPPEAAIPLLQELLGLNICVHMHNSYQSGTVKYEFAWHDNHNTIHINWYGAHFEALQQTSTNPSALPNKFTITQDPIVVGKLPGCVAHAIHDWNTKRRTFDRYCPTSELAGYGGFAGTIARAWDKTKPTTPYRILANQARLANEPFFITQIGQTKVLNFFANSKDVFKRLQALPADHYHIPAIGTGLFNRTFEELTAAINLSDSTFTVHLPTDSVPELRDQTTRSRQLLLKHGFQGRDGNKVTPIFYNTHLPPRARPTTKAGRHICNLLSAIDRHFYTFTPDKERALAYAKDLKEGRVGTLARRSHPLDNKLNPDQLAHKVEYGPSTTVNICVLLGSGGAGKSQLIQEALQDMREAMSLWTVVTPTQNLKIDWATKLKPTHSHLIKTYENALRDTLCPCVILDDASKLPPGYLDALLLSSSNIQDLIITGDTRQSTFHVEHPDSLSGDLPSCLDTVKHLSDYYINATHRNPKNIATRLNVYSEKPGGTWSFSQALPADGALLLVPSMKEAALINNTRGRAFTYAGCQGLTLTTANIVLTPATTMCSDRVLYTVLSRASRDIRFINTYHSQADFLSKLNATPYIKLFLTLTREHELTGGNAPEYEAPTYYPKIHLPIDNPYAFLANTLDALPTKEQREIYNTRLGELTNTIDETNEITAAIPRHRGSDRALFLETIAARLKSTQPGDNERDFQQPMHESVGRVLWLNYQETMNLQAADTTFNPDLWAQAKKEVEAKFLEKPTAALMNSIRRQDPDRAKNAIDIFLKSQWVQKPEKFAALKNKPGQTIAAFTQDVVMQTGQMARYIRRQEELVKPNNIFIYCEKNEKDLENWRRRYWDFSAGPAYANDYTQFDQSQDATTLHFALLRCRFWNIPPDTIDLYIFLKLFPRVFFGYLSIMRLTGEGPTFDENTATSIAYDTTRFDIPKDCARAYAGDDSARDRVCPEKPSWKLIEPHVLLKAKPAIAEMPTFCGWKITPHGVVRDPFKLWFSFKRAEAKGELQNVANSYRTDLMPAYLLGDLLTEIFSPAELEYHRDVCRGLHIQAHLDFNNQLITEKFNPTGGQGARRKRNHKANTRLRQQELALRG